MKLNLDLLPLEERKAKPLDESGLGFGRIFSDHMLMMPWSKELGWHEPRIQPYAPLQLDPAALVLHYGQGVFEGMKAYRGAEDQICMFRPWENIARLNRSCKRLCIPALPEKLVLEMISSLLKIEQEWIPKSPGTSLYIRPTVIATEGCLGVKVSQEYLFYVIVGPVGAYYAEGFNPVKIWVEERYIRAAPGGLGDAKTMANYAHSLLATEEAKKRGFTQVLWLDACDKRSIEEVGTMNMFFKIAGEIITAPLEGSILPGITRDSVLKLCESWGLPVSERRISIDEVLKAQADGSLEEAFGTGTAAVISPVGVLHYRGEDLSISGGGIGPLSLKLFNELQEIQFGQRADEQGWVFKFS